MVTVTIEGDHAVFEPQGGAQGLGTPEPTRNPADPDRTVARLREAASKKQ